MCDLPSDFELQEIIDFVERRDFVVYPQGGRFVAGDIVDLEAVLAILKELQELRAMRRAFMQPTGEIMNVFPNRIVEVMFIAYCKARGMNPNDWPTIGLEKQNAWRAAASAAVDEVR